MRRWICIEEPVDPKWQAQTLANIGEVYYSLGEMRKALEKSQRGSNDQKSRA